MNNYYKYLGIGRMISSAGDSIYQIAVMWYVYQLTQNPFYTGLAYSVTILPKVFQFLVGPFIDRGNKLSILIKAQFLQGGLLLVVPLAIWFNFNNIWIVLGVVFLTSLIENLEGSAEWAVVPMVVQEDDIPKYNSVISSAQQFFKLVSGGLFSILIVYISMPYIYGINALTFLVAGLLFKQIKMAKVNSQTSEVTKSNYLSDLKEGFQTFFSGQILMIIVPLWILNFTFGMINAVLPVYSSQFASGNGYGFYIVAISLGSLIGTIIAYKLSELSLRLLFIMLPILSSVCFVAGVSLEYFVGSLILVGMAFIPFGVITLLMMSYLQKAIPMDLLARMITIIDGMMVTTLPIGSLCGGLLATYFPSTGVMMFAGSGFLLMSLFFIMKPELLQPKQELIEE